MFIVIFIYFFEGRIFGRKRGEGKREMWRDIEVRERDCVCCVGGRERKTGRL